MLVLGAIAILSILAIELSHRARLDISQASRARRDAAYRRAFSSGLEIAKGLLLEGRTNPGFDYLGDPWNREISATLDRGITLNIKVVDESGKLNILQAVGNGDNAEKMRKALVRLFKHLHHLEPRRTKEWDEAEGALFKRLNLKEKQPPAPLYTLDGLREEGLSRELLFGGTQPEAMALCDCLTTFGLGRININTAPAPVLYALDSGLEWSTVDEIIQWRGGKGQGFTGSHRPFRQVKDLEMVNGIVQKQMINGQLHVTQNILLKIQDQICVNSGTYSVRIQAEAAGHSRVAWGFFELSGPLGATQESLNLVAYEEIAP